jgi:hypothetical protein
MRKARFLAFCRRPHLGVILASSLAFAGAGCHQHYYYYGDPCAPGMPAPATVRSGPVCDVTTQVVEGEATVADGSTRSTTVTGGQAKSPRVVVSEPASSSRFSWRRSEPDGSQATTSVSGSIDDAKVNR